MPNPRRKRILSWIPAGILVLGIAAFAMGAFAIENSWWTADDRTASADQQTAHGMSVFTGAGVDYFTAEGLVVVKLRDDGATATKLGLERTGTLEIEPIEVRVLGESGALVMPLVESMSLTARSDQLVAIELNYSSNGSYYDLLDVLRGLADNVEWTDADFEQLELDLGAASRAADGTYRAAMRSSPELGMTVVATITIDQGFTPELSVRLER